jgi:hypothetical protein
MERERRNETESKAPSNGNSDWRVLALNSWRFWITFGSTVIIVGGLIFYFGFERLWWLFVMLAVLGVCVIEGILGDAATRTGASFPRSTQRKTLWILLVGSLLLAAFLFIRRMYFYSP